MIKFTEIFTKKFIIIKKMNEKSFNDFQKLLELYNVEIGANWKDIYDISHMIIGKHFREEVRLILLKKGREVIGFSVYAYDFHGIKNKGFVCEFFIKKEFRRTKAGTFLYEFVENEFKNKNLAGAWLTTDSAPEFWKSQGFNPTGKNAKHNKCPVFEKTLNID